MKNLINIILQNIPYISLWLIIILLSLSLIGTQYYFILVLFVSYFDKADNRNIFDIQNLTEEEQRLHTFTLLNTKVNRDQSGYANLYVNESKPLNNFSL